MDIDNDGVPELLLANDYIRIYRYVNEKIVQVKIKQNNKNDFFVQGNTLLKRAMKYNKKTKTILLSSESNGGHGELSVFQLCKGTLKQIITIYLNEEKADYIDHRKKNGRKEILLEEVDNICNKYGKIGVHYNNNVDGKQNKAKFFLEVTNGNGEVLRGNKAYVYLKKSCITIVSKPTIAKSYKGLSFSKRKMKSDIYNYKISSKCRFFIIEDKPMQVDKKKLYKNFERFWAEMILKIDCDKVTRIYIGA